MALLRGSSTIKSTLKPANSHNRQNREPRLTSSTERTGTVVSPAPTTSGSSRQQWPRVRQQLECDDSRPDGHCQLPKGHLDCRCC